MNKNLLPIAKEGIVYVATSSFIVLLLLLFGFEFLAFIGILLTLTLIFSFRNPERALPEFSELSVVAVSDGIVKAIDELEDSEYAYRVEVESNSLNVGILRTPFNATLSAVKHINGTRVSKKSKQFLDLNEMLELTFEDNNNNSIKIIHRVKQSFFPLYLDVINSQKLRQTSRYGVMINGITTFYFPHNFRLNVNVGNELKASESLMGYFS